MRLGAPPSERDLGAARWLVDWDRRFMGADVTARNLLATGESRARGDALGFSNGSNSSRSAGGR